MNKQEFAARLRELRSKTELTQHNLAKAAGVLPRQYEDYENAIQPSFPSCKNVIALAKFHNCSLDYLLCLTDNPKHFRS